MSGGKPWPRQKAEIAAYNAFFSAYRSRNSYHGFSEYGYVVTNYFPQIDNRFTDGKIEPDFTLYNGETLMLAEVKQGNNISERAINQVEKLSNVSIDAAEEFLDKVDVDRFGFGGDVYSVEPLIYYDGLDSEYLEQCRHDWPDCRESLERMESKVPILGRENGIRLQLLAGEFRSQTLQNWLSYGIKMARNPRTTITMTDGLEVASIAVTLCRIWGERAVSSEISVKVTEIRNHFNYRDLAPVRVETAFDLLEDLDACDREGKREIVFSPDKMGKILNIETEISNIGASTSQSGLSNFG